MATRIDDGKLYSAVRESGLFDLYETRQSVDYSQLYQRYLADSTPGKTEFAYYLKPPCGLPSSARDLKTLFEHSFHEKLLRLSRFQGQRKFFSWSFLRCISQMIKKIPFELESYIGRVINFWEHLARLSGSEKLITSDKKTASKLSGLWPDQSEADDEFFILSMNSGKAFPLVKDVIVRGLIMEKIRRLNHRVPTLKGFVSETRALEKITQVLQNGLNEYSESNKLIESVISWNGKRANKTQYYECFLASARACDASRKNTLQQDLELIFSSKDSQQPYQIKKLIDLPTTTKRIANKGLWQSEISDCNFDFVKIFLTKQQGTSRQLPIWLLIQDFFAAYFAGIKEHFQITTTSSAPSFIDSFMAVPEADNNSSVELTVSKIDRDVKAHYKSDVSFVLPKPGCSYVILKSSNAHRDLSVDSSQPDCEWDLTSVISESECCSNVDWKSLKVDYDSSMALVVLEASDCESNVTLVSPNANYESDLTLISPEMEYESDTILCPSESEIALNTNPQNLPLESKKKPYNFSENRSVRVFDMVKGAEIVPSCFKLSHSQIVKVGGQFKVTSERLQM